jgi:zinc protease
VIPRGGTRFEHDKQLKLPPAADVRVTFRDERVRQPSLSRKYVAPSYSTGDKAEVDALQVFAEIAGGGATSKLYQALVVKRQIAASAGAGYDAAAASYGSLTFFISPNPGVSIDDAEKAMDEEIDAVLDGAITDDDVAKAKTRMMTALVFLIDSPLGAAQRVGAWVASGLPLSDLENWDVRLEAVTADAVRAAGATLLRSGGPSGTAVLLPTEAQP